MISVAEQAGWSFPGCKPRKLSKEACSAELVMCNCMCMGVGYDMGCEGSGFKIITYIYIHISQIERKPLSLLFRNSKDSD